MTYNIFGIIVIILMIEMGIFDILVSSNSKVSRTVWFDVNYGDRYNPYYFLPWKIHEKTKLNIFGSILFSLLLIIINIPYCVIILLVQLVKIIFFKRE